MFNKLQINTILTKNKFNFKVFIDYINGLINFSCYN